jgi:hypothetical protein
LRAQRLDERAALVRSYAALLRSAQVTGRTRAAAALPSGPHEHRRRQGADDQAVLGSSVTVHRCWRDRRLRDLGPLRWCTVRLDTISREDVQAWVDELHAGGMAPATVARFYHLLSASLKAAVVAGKLAASPCVSIELPRTPPADERYLSWAEVGSVAHFLEGRDALLLWLLFREKQPLTCGFLKKYLDWRKRNR